MDGPGGTRARLRVPARPGLDPVRLPGTDARPRPADPLGGQRGRPPGHRGTTAQQALDGAWDDYEAEVEGLDEDEQAGAREEMLFDPMVEAVYAGTASTAGEQLPAAPTAGGTVVEFTAPGQWVDLDPWVSTPKGIVMPDTALVRWLGGRRFVIGGL